MTIKSRLKVQQLKLSDAESQLIIVFLRQPWLIKGNNIIKEQKKKQFTLNISNKTKIIRCYSLFIMLLGRNKEVNHNFNKKS